MSSTDSSWRRLALLAWLGSTLLAASLWGPSGHAQAPDDVSLRWRAPQGCPDETSVLERIRKHLPGQQRPARHVSVEGQVTIEGGRYVMEIVLQSGESRAHRSIANESCDALADAAALLVALALDPEPAPPSDPDAPRDSAVERELDAEPVDTRPAPESPVVPEQAPPRSPAAGADQDQSDGAQAIAFGWDIAAALRFDFGMLPQVPAIGLQPQLGVSFDRVTGRIGVTFWLPARTRSESYPGAMLDAAGVVGNADVCLTLLRTPITLAPCATLELGQLVLEPHGISGPARSAARWAAVGGGLRAGLIVWRGLRTTLEAQGVAPFSRPRWLIRTPEGDRTLFATGRAALRVAVGLSYAFE